MITLISANQLGGVTDDASAKKNSKRFNEKNSTQKPNGDLIY